MSDKTEALLPCPFCGAPAHFSYYTFGDSAEDSCRAICDRGHALDAWSDDEDGAVEGWNERVTPPAADARELARRIVSIPYHDDARDEIIDEAESMVAAWTDAVLRQAATRLCERCDRCGPERRLEIGCDDRDAVLGKERS